MKELILHWLVSLIVSFAPPEKMAAAPQLPGWEETASQKQARYEEIASDLYEVLYEDKDTVPVFNGPLGNANTAALVLAVAAHESGFAHDVDKGPCYRGKDGKSSRCDGGRASCMLQIHMGANGKTVEGWTSEDIFKDRKKCFKAGMRGMRNSIRSCRKEWPKNPENWLAMYASGGCREGLKGSGELWALYKRFWSKLEVPEQKNVKNKGKAPAPPKEKPPEKGPTEQTRYLK